MFFVGVFGIENKEKEIRDIQNIHCRACGSLSSYKLVKTFNFFHFFFIPVFRWKEEYYLVSRCCQSVFSITKELGRALEEGNTVDIRHEDITPLNNSYVNNMCPSCHRRLDNSFEYCPYCGTKLR